MVITYLLYLSVIYLCEAFSQNCKWSIGYNPYNWIHPVFRGNLVPLWLPGDKIGNTKSRPNWKLKFLWSTMNYSFLTIHFKMENRKWKIHIRAKLKQRFENMVIVNRYSFSRIASWWKWLCKESEVLREST